MYLQVLFSIESSKSTNFFRKNEVTASILTKETCLNTRKIWNSECRLTNRSLNDRRICSVGNLSLEQVLQNLRQISWLFMLFNLIWNILLTSIWPREASRGHSLSLSTDYVLNLNDFLTKCQNYRLHLDLKLWWNRFFSNLRQISLYLNGI